MARLTVEFSEDAAQELEELSRKLSSKKVDVIRNALGLYSYVVRSLYAGGAELALAQGDNVQKVIVVPGVPPGVQHRARKP